MATPAEQAVAANYFGLPSNPDAAGNAPPVASAPTAANAPVYDPTTMGPIVGAAPVGQVPVRPPVMDLTNPDTIPAKFDQGPGKVNVGAPVVTSKPAPQAVPGGAAPAQTDYGIERAGADIRDARGVQLGAYDTNRNVAQVGSELQGQKADEVGRLSAVAYDNLERNRHADEFLARKEDERSAERWGQFQNESDAIASQKIDPDRVWKSKGTGDKIMYAIGGALGGMLSAWNGGPNSFLQTMRQIAQDDIDSQRDAKQSAKEALASKKEGFIRLDQQGQSKILRDIQHTNNLYEAAKAKIGLVGAQYDSEVARKNAAGAIAAIDNEQARLREFYATQLKAEGQQQRARDQAAAAAASNAALERKALQLTAGMDTKDGARAMLEAGLPLSIVNKFVKSRSELGEIDLKAAEAASKGNEQQSKDQQYIAAAASDLAKPEFQRARTEVNAVLDSLPKLPNGRPDFRQGFPGMGWSADTRESILGKRFGLSDDERVGRQRMERMALAYKNMVTGSGGSDREAEAIGNAFTAAKTPAELEEAVRQAETTVKGIETQRLTALTPSQRATYEKQKQASRYFSGETPNEKGSVVKSRQPVR
jgi:hypothetical protein